MPPTLLIIDPDREVASSIANGGASAGVAVGHALDAEEATRQLSERLPDLIVLEWLLPGVSGVEFARRLRSHPRTREVPLIMLSSREGEADRVAAFESGIDDFVGKPFSVSELLARARGLMRAFDHPEARRMIAFGPLRLDPTARRLSCQGEDVAIGPVELRLLELLMSRPNRILSRPQIIDHVWQGSGELSERTVDVYIRRVRAVLRKLGQAHLLQTLRGEGYLLATAFDGSTERAR